jgi:hypothetical protein
LDINDPRWEGLEGGYRAAYDPRPALRSLSDDSDPSKAWEELWNELHHQGDVGEASYAAIPHIVDAYIRRGPPGWNAYAMLVCIELARDAEDNPPVPGYLRASYLEALQRLSLHGQKELESATDPDLVRCIIAVIALSKGMRALARLAWDFDDAELRTIVAKIDEGPLWP